MSALSIVGRLIVGSIALLIIPVMAVLIAVSVCALGVLQVIYYIVGGKI